MYIIVRQGQDNIYLIGAFSKHDIALQYMNDYMCDACYIEYVEMIK